MDQQQAAAFIARQLDLGCSPQEAAQRLCQQTGWPLQPVERFVQRVAADSRASQAAAPPQRLADPWVVPAPDPEPAPLSSAASQANSLSARPARVSLGESGPEAAITNFVISELGKHRSHDQVIYALCQSCGWSWPQAERFVRKVEIEHANKIAARQSPIFIILGVGGILAGLFIMGAMGYLTLNGDYISLAGFPVPYLENLVYFFTGLGMLIGGIAGIWRSITMIRDR